MKFQAKHVILTVAAAVLLAAGTLLLVYRERTISVVEHLGDVLISKVLIRKEIGVYDGMRMEQGDKIHTGEQARAVLELDEAVSLFTRLGDAQKKALGTDRHDKIDSMYKQAHGEDPAYVPEVLPSPMAAQRAASDVKRESGTTPVKEDVTIQVESEEAQPVRTVAGKLGEEFEIVEETSKTALYVLSLLMLGVLAFDAARQRGVLRKGKGKAQ